MASANHIELYKKYRAAKWRHLIGQEKVAKSLVSALTGNSVPTAYAFFGDRGCGKTSSAKLFAKSLNCENNKDEDDNIVDADPCNQCDICLNIDSNSQLGVHYISMANAGSVDDVRKIAKDAQMSAPVRRQVWILDEAHNLSKQAWDSLLIPLESPTMSSLFIFCSTEEEKIPKTILSRVQSRNFTLVDSETLGKHLKRVANAEDMEVSSDQLKEAVRRSRGSVRDALSALETIVGSEDTEFRESYTERIITAIAEGKFHNALIASSEANSEGANFKTITEQMFSDMRDMIILAAGGERRLAGVPSLSDPEATAKQLGYSTIVRCLDHLGSAMSNITFGADARLHFEVALTKMFVSSKNQKN